MSMALLNGSSSAPPTAASKTLTPARPQPAGSWVSIRLALNWTPPSAVAAAAKAKAGIRIESSGATTPRKRKIDPRPKLGLPTVARRPAKSTTSIEQDERVGLLQSRPQKRQKREEPCHPSPIPVIIVQEPTSPLPRRGGPMVRAGPTVRWADSAQMVTVERTSTEWLAQRAYGLATYFAKQLRKKTVPDAFIDAVFELEERVVEAYGAAIRHRVPPSQIRCRVKVLIHQRLSVYKVACSKDFLKALASMGCALLRLVEEAEKHGPSQRVPDGTKGHSECVAIKAPSSSSSPHSVKIVSPTCNRALATFSFAKASVNRSVPTAEHFFNGNDAYL